VSNLERREIEKVPTPLRDVPIQGAGSDAILVKDVMAVPDICQKKFNRLYFFKRSTVTFSHSVDELPNTEI
jgi:hypothetical protein